MTCRWTCAAEGTEESGKGWVTANAPTFYERGKQAATYSIYRKNKNSLPKSRSLGTRVLGEELVVIIAVDSRIAFYRRWWREKAQVEIESCELRGKEVTLRQGSADQHIASVGRNYQSSGFLPKYFMIISAQDNRRAWAAFLVQQPKHDGENTASRARRHKP